MAVAPETGGGQHWRDLASWRPKLVQAGDELAAAANFELFEDRLEPVLDRVWGEVELSGDLLGGVSLDDQFRSPAAHR
jgi:hypothetical protein